MVGAVGFELTTLCSQSRCATRLRYAPKKRAFYRWSLVRSIKDRIIAIRFWVADARVQLTVAIIFSDGLKMRQRQRNLFRPSARVTSIFDGLLHAVYANFFGSAPCPAPSRP